MFYLTKIFLLEIRKRREVLYENRVRWTLIAILPGILSGVGLDYFTTTTPLISIAKMAVALFVAVFAFSITYSVFITRSKESSDYKSPRERFSYRQRLNISILTTAFVVVFALLSVNSTLFFTFASAVQFFIVLWVFTFLRPTRTELIRGETGLGDPRDRRFKVYKDREMESEEIEDDEGEDE